MHVKNQNFLIYQFVVCGFVLGGLLATTANSFAGEANQNPQEMVRKINLGEEVKHYQSLIQENPQNLAHYNNLAVLYARMGDLKSARRTLEQGLNAQADVATLYSNFKTINLELSRKDYASALRLDIETREVNLVRIEAAETRQQINPPVKETKQVAASEHTKAGPDQDQITNMVFGWASAWSAQEVDLYLSFYSNSFVPTGSLSRNQWAQSRRKRLKRPSWVSVKVSDLTVKPASQQKARVVFMQDYRSSNYSDKSRKELVLEYIDSGWQIIKESTL